MATCNNSCNDVRILMDLNDEQLLAHARGGADPTALQLELAERLENALLTIEGLDAECARVPVTAEV